MGTEDRVRSSLLRRAEQIAGSDEDSWQAILDRIQRRKGRPVQRAVAALIALAVAGAGIGVAVWTLGRNVQRPAAVFLPERIAFVEAASKHKPGVHSFDIFTVRPDGTDLRSVTNGGALEGPVSWSRDGSTVAFVHRPAAQAEGSGLDLHAGVYVMKADGAGLRDVVACQKSYGRLPCDVRLLPLSPDGSQLAYVRFSNGPPHSIFVIGSDGTGSREIPCPQCGLGIGPLAWSPDGTKLAFGGDLADMIGGDIGPRLSPLYVADVRTGTVEKLPDVTTASPYPSWSPDGSSIVLTSDRVSGPGPLGPVLTHDIVVIDLDGAAQKTILSCAHANCSAPEAPVWSPDGTRFAFIDRTGGGGEIWIIAADGSILQRSRPCAEAPCVVPDNLVWSPDGRRLAFQALTEDRSAWDLYVVGADGKDLRRVAARTDGILAWLPSLRVAA